MLTYEDFRKEYQDIEVEKNIFLRYQSLIKRKTDYLTFNRIDYNDEKELLRFNLMVKSLILEFFFSGLLLDKPSEDGKQREIKSESVGEYSVSFSDKDSKGLSDKEKLAYIDKLVLSAIKETYGHTGLMYRGVI